MSKWFGYGENECFVVWIGLLLFVTRVRVEIGTDLGVFKIDFVVVQRNHRYRDFVLSKGLVRLKSARVFNEGLRFYQGAG